MSGFLSSMSIMLSLKPLSKILGNVFFFSGKVFDAVRSRVLELVVLPSGAAMEGGTGFGSEIPRVPACRQMLSTVCRNGSGTGSWLRSTSPVRCNGSRAVFKYDYAGVLLSARQNVVKAYDSDPLDEELLREEGIEVIAPHQSNRKKEPTQAGRKLRRYKRRWKVERLFTWVRNYRRVVVRWEYCAEDYFAFVLLVFVIILLRYF